MGAMSAALVGVKMSGTGSLSKTAAGLSQGSDGQNGNGTNGNKTQHTLREEDEDEETHSSEEDNNVGRTGSKDDHQNRTNEGGTVTGTAVENNKTQVFSFSRPVVIIYDN